MRATGRTGARPPLLTLPVDTMPYKILLVVLLVALLGWAGTMIVLSLSARRPADFGLREGRLAPCPATLNCVCSCAEAGDEHAIAPLTFEGSPDEAWKRLGEVLAEQPRMAVVSETPTYRHVECTSRVFRFVDDLELLLDREGKKVHVRSASRVGRSDLGANRRRVEAIRRAFEARRGG
jgi:uncharacterized protein (DUF1499 family)